MVLAQNRLVAATLQKLRTKVGVRFTRFVGVAAAALATSEILLSVCNGVLHMTATPAAAVATFSGAAVSYVLSRWAWERKGRPDLLRETLPFWIVSIAAWSFLSFISHEASIWSRHMGHTGIEHVAVINGAYFLANCFTFVARFVIFHYVLFASHGNKARAAQVLSPSQQLAEAEEQAARQGGTGRPADDETAQAPMELGGQPRARR